MKILVNCENPFALPFDDDERVPYPKWKFRRKHLKTWKFIKSTKIPFNSSLFCVLFFCISCLPEDKWESYFLILLGAPSIFYSGASGWGLRSISLNCWTPSALLHNFHQTKIVKYLKECSTWCETRLLNNKLRYKERGTFQHFPWRRKKNVYVNVARKYFRLMKQQKKVSKTRKEMFKSKGEKRRGEHEHISHFHISDIPIYIFARI